MTQPVYWHGRQQGLTAAAYGSTRPNQMIDVATALEQSKYEGETDAEHRERLKLSERTYYRLKSGSTPSLGVYAKLVKAGVVKEPGRSLARSVEE